MGQKFNFSCGTCGYKAIISDGKDGGRFATTQTFICRECKELHDIVTETFVQTNDLINPTEEIKRLSSRTDLIPRLKELEKIDLNSLGEKEITDLEQRLRIKIRVNKWIEEELIQCPSCKSNSLDIWDNKERQCPKCTGTLKKGTVPTMFWD